MNRWVLVGVVVLATLAVWTDAHRRPGRKCGWWRRRCKRCTPYDPKTHYCCRPYGRGCCKKPHHHALPDCSNGNTTYHAVKCSCNHFFECKNGTLSKHKCAPRGAWNDKDKKCDFVMNRRPKFCGNRPYKGMSLRMVWAKIKMEIYDKRNGTEKIASFSDSAPQDVLYNVLTFCKANRQDFDFTTTFDPVYWEILACMNGVCAGPGDKWKYKINGVIQKKGISYPIAPNGATVVFALFKK